MGAVAGFVWTAVRPYALQALVVLLGVITVLGVLAKVKRNGVLQERMETQVAVAKSIQRQAEARAKAPQSVDEVIDAMEKGTF